MADTYGADQLIYVKDVDGIAQSDAANGKAKYLKKVGTLVTA